MQDTTCSAAAGFCGDKIRSGEGEGAGGGGAVLRGAGKRSPQRTGGGYWGRGQHTWWTGQEGVPTLIMFQTRA